MPQRHSSGLLFSRLKGFVGLFIRHLDQNIRMARLARLAPASQIFAAKTGDLRYRVVSLGAGVEKRPKPSDGLVAPQLVDRIWIAPPRRSAN